MYQPRCLRAIRTPTLLAIESVVIAQMLERSASRTSATVGGGRCVPVARKCAISRKIHGRPCAARPIMIASAPVCSSTALAFSGVAMSPFAITGIATACLTARNGVVLDGADERAGARAAVHRQRRDARILRDARDRTALRSPGCQPVRILRVTGTSTARTTASTMRRDQRLVREQRRAGRGVADLLRRAAHVDVDDLRAALDVVARGLGHHRRIGAGDLHRDRRASPA